MDEGAKKRAEQLKGQSEGSLRRLEEDPWRPASGGWYVGIGLPADSDVAAQCLAVARRIAIRRRIGTILTVKARPYGYLYLAPPDASREKALRSKVVVKHRIRQMLVDEIRLDDSLLNLTTPPSENEAALLASSMIAFSRNLLHNPSPMEMEESDNTREAADLIAAYAHTELSRVQGKIASLGRLSVSLTELEEAKERLATAAREARDAGATWVEIARVAGSTPQAAQQRWGRPPSAK